MRSILPQNGFYFITICTHNRQNLFAINEADNTCNLLVKRWLFEIEAKFPDVTICKYVIMPDHIHFILSVKNGQSGTPVPTDETIKNDNKNSVIAKFISTFKRFSNKEYGENIWQPRYYDHIIRNQKDYNEILEYIENNPRKWILTKETQGV